MKRFKVLNPILHCNSFKYNEIANVSRRTWMINSGNEILSFFYQGGSESNYMDNDILNLKCEDSWSNPSEAIKISTIKMLLMFEYFLIRSSNSTFIHFDVLLKKLNNIDNIEFYGGQINEVKNNFSNDKKVAYALGQCFMLSNDLVKSCVENKEFLINSNMIDDIALGYYLHKHFNLKFQRINRWGLWVRCKPPNFSKLSQSDWVAYTSNRFKKLYKNGHINR